MLRLPVVDLAPAPIEWHGLPRRFMNLGEVEAIVALMREIRPRRVAEFGIHEGRTARLILENIPGITEYIGVDVGPKYRPDKGFQRNEIPREPGRWVAFDPRVRLHVTPRGTLDLTAGDLGDLDAVFIDGDHGRATVEHDTRLAHAAVRPGGLVIWHDYHDLGTVDVADVLHDLLDHGHALKTVRNTWVAFEVAGCVAAIREGVQFPACVIGGAPQGQAPGSNTAP